MEKLNWTEIPLEGDNSLIDAFRKVKDPRSRFGKSLDLAGILAVSFCAIATGSNSYEAISDWGKSLTTEQLAKFGLKRPPSASFLQKTFRILDNENIETVLIDWLIESDETLVGKIIAFDGKTNRGSRTATNKGIHLVTAILHDKKEIIYQKRVSSKSNEIPALRDMVKEMNLNGATITADAAHTNAETVRTIVEDCKSNFAFIVKDNQPTIKKN